MGISVYLKDIGRGKDGARSLDRAQSADLMGRILDGEVSDLELGAFCIAMRVKGETPLELAGFLDAIHARLPSVSTTDVPTVVLPSYNGARKLPVLTPLLALLLARCGLRVLIHGQSRDPDRITSAEILRSLHAQGVSGIYWPNRLQELPPSVGVAFLPTHTLLPALQKLLDVRRTIGLRNSAHSLVKLMQPVPAAVLVTSYTHPEYLHSMSALFRLSGQTALLLRGTEGEPVADPRRTPQMALFHAGQSRTVQPAQTGPLACLPELPPGTDIALTTAYIRAVLDRALPTPLPIALQVHHLCDVCRLSPTPALESSP